MADNNRKASSEVSSDEYHFSPMDSSTPVDDVDLPQNLPTRGSSSSGDGYSLIKVASDQ